MNKEQATAEIMHLFRFFYKDQWAPDNLFDNKSRIWIQSFNDLIKQGFILKKRKYPGHQYKWTGIWPENY